VKKAPARLMQVLSAIAVRLCAGLMIVGHVPAASAQILNESPPPGYPSSGCDYDQRGNRYCWGGANNQTVPPPPVTQSAPGVDPFVGCFRWFNGVPVQIHTDHAVLAGPFKAHWQLVNSAQRSYTITWPQPAVSTETLSADGKTLTGGNQYGGKDKATRSVGSDSPVGTWTWVDVLTSTVIVKADGTWLATSAGISWHGRQSTDRQGRTRWLHRICRRTGLRWRRTAPICRESTSTGSKFQRCASSVLRADSPISRPSRR
jgi:hypothetical protein